MHLFFRYCVVVVLVGALLGGARFVFADEANVVTSTEIDNINKEIDARKEKIKQLEATIATYQNSINQKQTESVSLQNQLSILDEQNQSISADINLTQEKIRQAELEIEALTISITEKEAVIARQKGIITQIIHSLNADSRRKYIEILLTYTNFADFYSNLTSLEYVYVDLGRSVKSVRLAKEDLNAKQAQVTDRKKNYEDLKIALDQKKEQLVEQAAYKQKLLTDTKSSEREYRTLLASLKNQYQVVETEQTTYEDKLRKKLANEDVLKPIGDTNFSWPTPSHVINALFHDPSYPFRKVFEHNGLDIKAAYGTPLRAAGSGYVAQAKRCTTASCYSYVMILHTTNVSTVYGHLSQVLVNVDQFVNRGDVIGYSGGTPGTVGAGPFVTGAHLHFEVRVNGIPVDPLGYLIQ